MRKPLIKKTPILIIATVLLATLLGVQPLLPIRFAPLILNVKDAGALGDGISDDTAAFQSTLKRAAAHRGRVQVIIPEGTYLLDPGRPLPLYDQVQLVGYRDPVLKFHSSVRSGSGSDLADTDTDNSGFEAIAVSGRHVRIEGLVIDGAYHLVRGIGIHTGSEQVMVKNTVIKRMSQPRDSESPLFSAVVSGIMIYGGTKEITIDASLITDIQAIHDQPVARGIMVWNQPRAAPARLIRISNNTISHIRPREDADGIYFDKTEPGAPLSESVIEGNRIHHTGKRGVKIAAPGVLVTNNHITNSYSGNNPYLFSVDNPLPQDMYSAISIYANHVTVSDNIIDGLGTYFAAIEADSGPLNGIIIEHNDISGGEYSKDNNSTGIRLGALEGFTVTGNHIRNMQAAFFMSDTGKVHGSLFSNNQVSDVEIGIRYPEESAPRLENP